MSASAPFVQRVPNVNCLVKEGSMQIARNISEAAPSDTYNETEVQKQGDRFAHECDPSL